MIKKLILFDCFKRKWAHWAVCVCMRSVCLTRVSLAHSFRFAFHCMFLFSFPFLKCACICLGICFFRLDRFYFWMKTYLMSFFFLVLFFIIFQVKYNYIISPFSFLSPTLPMCTHPCSLSNSCFYLHYHTNTLTHTQAHTHTHTHTHFLINKYYLLISYST